MVSVACLDLICVCMYSWKTLYELPGKGHYIVYSQISGFSSKAAQLKHNIKIISIRLAGETLAKGCT